MNRCFIALGSNLGDRMAILDEALDELAALGRLRRPPSVYETRPVGPSSAPFLNGVAELRCALDPRDLLQRLHALEAKAGRQRSVRWGARTLDLDLLAVQDASGVLVHSESAPVLPHPRLHLRDFVLAPLCDLDPELLVHGTPAHVWLERVPVGERTIVARLRWG